MQAFVLLCALPFIVGLQIRTSPACFRRDLSLQAKIDGVVVVGAAGGAAEVLAVTLAASKAVTLLLDQKPFSPKIAEFSSRIKVYHGEFDKSEVLRSILQGKAVVALEDPGDPIIRGEEEEKERKNSALSLIADVAKVLPSVSAGPVVLGVGSPVEEKGGGGPLLPLFSARGAASIKGWCNANQRPLSVFVYGKLTGGVPGLEPLPFLSLPLQEPELHPSYLLTSALCSAITPQDSKASLLEAFCTRNALADAVEALLVGYEGGAGGMLAEDVRLVSVEGPALSPQAWQKLFQRLRVSAQGELDLLQFDFKEVKGGALLAYLQGEWFPRAFIESDAAVTLAGARPTRCIRSSPSSLSIVWEDLLPDRSIQQVGELVLELKEKQEGGGSLVVRRKARSLLNGEGRLVDQLVEGVNSQAVKKKLCVLDVDA